MDKDEAMCRIMKVNEQLREYGYDWIDIELFWKDVFEKVRRWESEGEMVFDELKEELEL